MNDLGGIRPQRIGTGELAMRAVNRPGAWFVLLVADPEECKRAAREVLDELSLLAHNKPLDIVAGPDPAALAQAFEGSTAGELVVSGLELFSGDEWAYVDRQRSQFQRRRCVILVLPIQSMELLMHRAPNLASWIGSTVWTWDESADELSSEEREQRLASLRDWAGFSDSELIRRARTGNLPDDPEYAEWLVLIGKGDLIGEG